MSLRKIIKNWADGPYIPCDDVYKCGQCLREQLKSEVCKEFLSLHTGDIDTVDIVEIEAETKRLFQQTPLYKRVKSLQDQGQSLQDIEADLRKEGIEI